MNTSKILLLATLFVLIATMLTSCFENEDSGPLQEQTKEYPVTDFQRLEMGDAFNVTVTQGSTYSVVVNGDRRNIDDLEIRKMDNTLKINYTTSGRPVNRQYTTYVTITMPTLQGVSFSAAVNSNISGFQTLDALDINLSGASKLSISGSTTNLQAVVSGASELRAFDLETATATVDASGASKIDVLATLQLKATASGASHISYRGNPAISSSTSGASSIDVE